MNEGLVKGGRSRGASNAPSDWMRDGSRIELKSSGWRFCRGRRLWHCHFQGIKPHLLDELWLAIYGPLGIRFYRSHSFNTLNLVTNGIATKHQGFQAWVYGPRRKEDPLKALQVIDEKMVSKGCDLVAFVQWDEGG